MLQNWKAHIFRPAYYPPLHHGAHSLLPSISFAPTDFTHYYTSRPTPPQAHILLNAFTAAFRINETVSLPKNVQFGCWTDMEVFPHGLAL